MSFDPGWKESLGLKKRFLAFSLAATVIFLLLVLRLWYLQIIKVDRYRALSERNRIRYIPIAAARGPIYDSKGHLLVGNRPSFEIAVLRQEVGHVNRLLSRLAGFLKVDPKVLRKRWEQGTRFPSYRPLPLAEDVSRDVLEKVEENSVDLPGVIIQVRPMRAYPDGNLAAHLLGYLGEITEKELESPQYADYHPGDFVGKSGLEKVLEPYLRGQEGERRVEVDVKGKELRLLQTQDPVPGDRVYLTIDSGLQKVAENAFGKQAGAAVVLNVKTGAVLAMVSAPSFNPADFASGISGTEWIKLLRNSRHPLQNKAIQGVYPPGSTFKIVTALAALKAGVITPSTVLDCKGYLHLGNREFRCWKKTGHGLTDLKKAIRESCDVYFYQVGLDVGIDRIADMAHALGLGQKLGFVLPGEKAGLIPDRAWKRKRFGTRWYDGETVIAAIGQGYVLVTPLQLAVMTAAVANGGKVLHPYLIKRIEDLDGNVVKENSPEVLNDVQLSKSDLRAVRRGLVAVVNEAHGTGWSAHLDKVEVAGKTGTAQVVKLKDEKRKGGDIPYRFRDHALFVAYAPADHPKIAVAVVVEHGTHGGSAAGPITKAILEKYFGISEKPTVVVPAHYEGD